MISNRGGRVCSGEERDQQLRYDVDHKCNLMLKWTDVVSFRHFRTDKQAYVAFPLKAFVVEMFPLY